MTNPKLIIYFLRYNFYMLPNVSTKVRMFFVHNVFSLLNILLDKQSSLVKLEFKANFETKQSYQQVNRIF